MKIWEMFKKVVAIVIAIYMFLFCCFTRAHASGGLIFAESVKYLIPLFEAILVGSGTYTADQVSDMTDQMLFNAAGNLADMSADEFLKLVADLGIKLHTDDAVNGMVGASVGVGFNLKDWILSHQADVATTIQDGYDLGGAGAVLVKRDAGCNWTTWYYGDYGLITDSGKYEILYYRSVRVFDDGTIGYDREHNPCSSISVSTYERLIGDWRFDDGTQVDDTSVVIPAEGEAVPNSIGEVIIDGVPYPINADGTVTIGGIDYPINSDGSITINGNTYYPTYNITYNYSDSAISDLLRELLKAINGLTLVEEDTSSELTFDETVLPDALALSDFAGLQLPSGITSVFPFCLPFDFVRGLQLFAAEPEVPYFEVNIKTPELFGVVPEIEWNYVIDLSMFEEVAKITRWCSLISFSFVLIFLSSKIVKGAGA